MENKLVPRSHLSISETFYSIQGEGPSMGMPAVFLRLAGCNLQCPGFSYKDPKTNEHLGCDTKLVWTHGQKKTFVEIITEWQENSWLEKLNLGAHLVITGGEPLLQQEGLLGFLNLLHQQVTQKIYIELETNATIAIHPDLVKFITQINASPKLKHSGESREKAYAVQVLKNFVSLSQTRFKFVIATPNDIQEVIEEFIHVFQIKPRNIWLMPEGGTRAAIQAKQQWLVELCKKHLMNYSPRLHIDIWDEATGV